MPTFSSLGLSVPLERALARQEITAPTPIQIAVLPPALKGRNVLGRAKTGSGKTLSFGLPVLARLAEGKRQPKSPRAIILVPTRELATQVHRALSPLAEPLHLRLMTVLGGMPINRQAQRLREGVDVVIATPGRLGDLVQRGDCRLDQVEITVLDEADHLCDLGFFKPVDALLAATPRSAQRLLLSATLDGDVNRLVKRHLPEHVLHEIESSKDLEGPMDHHLIVAERTNKFQTAHRLLEQNPRTIVFARTRRGASRLARQLTTGGIDAVDLHGDLNQSRRERNLARFSKGDAAVIVATDIAARGIHVDDVKLVMHYDAPAEHKAYTHRSGRTARAGEAGTVITLTTPEDLREVVALQRKAGVAARQHRADRLPATLTASTLAESGEIVAVQPSSGGGQGRSSGGGSQGQNRNRNRSRSGGQGGGQPRSQGGGQSRGQGGGRGRSQGSAAGSSSRGSSQGGRPSYR
ncbi:MAG: DEAD/DEAH box helicase [Actinomycetales bacterium]|nr:MAG: DEAD/DEAH box helicase [Actinomycetales bacterium]